MFCNVLGSLITNCNRIQIVTKSADLDEPLMGHNIIFHLIFRLELLTFAWPVSITKNASQKNPMKVIVW